MNNYLSEESARIRFFREARAAASVRHPNVASVYHLGRSGRIISMRWSFWRERRSRTSSNAPAGLKRSWPWKSLRQSRFGFSCEPTNRSWSTGISSRATSWFAWRREERWNSKDYRSRPGQSRLTTAPQAAISTQEPLPVHQASPVPSNLRELGVDIRSDLYSLGATLWRC